MVDRLSRIGAIQTRALSFVVAGALASMLVLALPFSVAHATTSSEIASHQSAAEAARKKAAAAEAKARALANEIENLDNNIETLTKQAAALTPQIADASKTTQTLTSELRTLQTTEQRLRAAITRTQAQYQEQQGLLSDRVIATYKQGDNFFLEILLSASNFKDLLSRTEYIARALESNAEFAKRLATTRRELDANKVELDRVIASARKKQQEAASFENRLRTMKASRRQAVANTESLQDQKATLMSDTKKNAKRLRALAEQEEAEAAKLQSELSGNGSGVFHGRMTWPTPGFTRVTSGFGFRICPFHGRELHPGIDIGRRADGTAIYGAAIVAAGRGTVLSAGYRGGYGNTVIIDHGNGVTTLYAHQAAGGIRVSAGQHVSAGQRIGTVGSTGNSTGPHLHWEVRVNGVPKNPLTY